MKRKNRFRLIGSYILLFVGLNNLDVNAQAVGISATPTFTPNPSSILDISSTTKGILIPRLSAVQRAALQASFSVAPATPASANGLMIYNTDSKKFNYWDGTKWNDVGAGSAAVPYWYFGSGDPGIDVPATGVSYLGAPNDYYYNNSNGRLFRKNSSHQWAIVRTNPGDEIVTFKSTIKVTVAAGAISALNTGTKVDFAVPNAVLGAVVAVSPEQELPGAVVISYARVKSNGIVEVRFNTVNGGIANIPAANYHIAVTN